MQVKGIVGVAVVISLLLLSNCRQDSFDNKAQVDEAARIAGGQLYDNYCASCHRGLMAKAPRLASLKMMSHEAIVATLQTGVMRAIGSRFTKEQHEQIATFISAQRESQSSVVLGKCDSPETGELIRSATSIGDWGMGYENLRFQNNQHITSKNVKQMKLSWVFAFPNSSRARVQPTIVGNTLFTADQYGIVYALDRLTGCIRWTFKADAEIRSAITVGFDDNDHAERIYFSDFNAHVYAVDLKTKKLVWKNVDTLRTSRVTQSQTREPSTRGRRYKKHIFIHGLRTDASNKRGSRQTGEDKSYRHKRGKAGD